DEDEKFTLEDAGLTFDELTTEHETLVTDEPQDDEEDIRITIDEIDPNLNVDNIENELSETETILTGEDKEFPDIEIDEYDDVYDDEDKRIDTGDTIGVSGGAVAISEDSGDEIDLDEEDDYFKRDEDEIYEDIPDIVPGGAVGFSIDYSLKYSRVGAFVRLIGLYLVGLLPHFFVLLMYSILSSILGVINNIVVISTGKRVEDFSMIQENTVRYFLSLYASSMGVVEEMPIFTGKGNIDYPLQMDMKYSMRYSKLLAVLRFSILGILLVLLPHLIILSLLSIVVPIIFIVGNICVLVIGKWPYFLFDFYNRYFRYLTRITAYLIGLVDTYPSFKLN
ncbi:DUF4389 domain-containing protein, partial [Spirochaetota bacterium]